MKPAYFLLLLLSIVNPLTANSPRWAFEDKNDGWNSYYFVQQYFHNSECQRQWAWELLGRQKFEGNERILDFGCGDGKLSAELARIAHNGNVVGIDISEQMIEFAKFKFPFNNLQFKTIKSLDASDIQETEKFDIICSFCVFHLLANPLSTLQNLKPSLKNDGKLLLVIPAGRNQALFSAAEATFLLYNLQAPWKDSPAPKVSIRSMEGCTQILKEAGFQIVSIKMNDSPTPFFDKEELIQWMAGNTSANWKIPADIAYLFFRDLVEKMCALDPQIIDDNGHIQFKLSRIELEAKHCNQ